MPGNFTAGNQPQDNRQSKIRLICFKCGKEIHSYDLDCAIDDGVIKVYHLFCGCPLGFINLKGESDE
jgi:hypothetical protein